MRQGASQPAGLLRPRYFDRQQLTAADLTAGQDYVRERMRRHNRFLHGWGVVCGAVVVAAATPWTVTVGEGYAITPDGDEVYVPAGAAAFSIEAQARECLCIDQPCPDPGNLTLGPGVPGNPAPRGVVYLALYAAEENTCPQPAVPARCQPPGGAYGFSRVAETYRLAVVCELPPSHEGQASCRELQQVICGNGLVACPPQLQPGDNGVILAALTVTADGIVDIDNVTHRRQLLSERMVQAWLACQCQLPAAGSITAIVPQRIVAADQAQTVNAVIQGQGLAGAAQVIFAGAVLAQVTDNSDPAQLRVTLTIAADAVAGSYSFLVMFADGRPALLSSNFNVFFTVVQAGTPPTVFTLFTLPPFTIFSIFTQPPVFTVFTQPPVFSVFTQPPVLSLFTQPPVISASPVVSAFTRPPVLSRFTGPIIRAEDAAAAPELNAEEFDLERGRAEGVEVVNGIGEARGRRLRMAGIATVLDLATAPVERVAEVIGTSAVRGAALVEAARKRIRRP